MKKRQAILAKRLDQINKACPDIWKLNTVLYVGAHSKQFSFGEIFKKNKVELDILEISEERCEEMRTLEWINDVKCGSVEDVKKIVDKSYELVTWFGGPAVLAKDIIKPTLDKLFCVTEKILCITTPWGKRTYTKDRLENLQRTEYKYDIQWTPLFPDDFIKWEFEVSTIGEPNHQYNGNIFAWKSR